MSRQSSKRRSPRRRRRTNELTQLAQLDKVLRDRESPHFRSVTHQRERGDVYTHLILNAATGRTPFLSRRVRFSQEGSLGGELPFEAEGVRYGFLLALIQYWLEQWQVPRGVDDWYLLQELPSHRKKILLALYRRALEDRF